jgi:hypothetical protein
MKTAVETFHIMQDAYSEENMTLASVLHYTKYLPKTGNLRWMSIKQDNLQVQVFCSVVVGCQCSRVPRCLIFRLKCMIHGKLEKEAGGVEIHASQQEMGEACP